MPLNTFRLSWRISRWIRRCSLKVRSRRLRIVNPTNSPLGRTNRGLRETTNYLLEFERREITVAPRAGETVTVSGDPARLFDPAANGWFGGDMHVHMNYSGDLVCTPADAARMQGGEGLHLVNLVAANCVTSLVYDHDCWRDLTGQHASYDNARAAQEAQLLDEHTRVVDPAEVTYLSHPVFRRQAAQAGISKVLRYDHAYWVSNIRWPAPPDDGGCAIGDCVGVPTWPTDPSTGRQLLSGDAISSIDVRTFGVYFPPHEQLS